ncbi:MAG TPA: co-chaperone DjlA [Steroidobacteraceae bacterium]|nr:co-chaperone DjlA [Steroidobacteraceae bacterium]
MLNWKGKVIGGALGFLVGNVPGAAIGVIVGHQFDSGAARSGFAGGGFFGAGPDPLLVNQLFFPTTFRVMGHIAKADGRVSEQEIASARAIMHALHLQQGQVQAAIGYFGEGKQPAYDLAQDLRRLRGAIAAYPELAYFFVQIQLQAALGGNGLPPLLRARLQRVASTLGVGASDFDRMESVLRFRMGASGYGRAGAGADPFAGLRGGAAGVSEEQRVAQAYRVLAAEPSMSDEEVVKCYRRQMSRHHPDKLKANGLPDSMLERAKEEAQEIQAAYELLRLRRGMR